MGNTLGNSTVDACDTNTLYLCRDSGIDQPGVPTPCQTGQLCHIGIGDGRGVEAGDACKPA
jgi:hypothetical protein